MKVSYSFNGAIYSAVVCKDGSVLEVRRGDVTFPRNSTNAPNRWASVAEWESSWPEGAERIDVPSKPKSSLRKEVLPPLEGIFATLKPNLKIGKRDVSPYYRMRMENFNRRYEMSFGAGDREHLANCVKWCKRALDNLYQGKYELRNTRNNQYFTVINNNPMPIYHSKNMIFLLDRTSGYPMYKPAADVGFDPATSPIYFTSGYDIRRVQ